MRQRIRSHLTYANVMVTILAFIVLGGSTAMAALVISSNSQVGMGTISGHKPPTGKHANIIAGSINGIDIADRSGVETCKAPLVKRFGPICASSDAVARTWTAAIDHCAGLGLRLPSFSEAIALANNYNVPGVSGGQFFWVDSYVQNSTNQEAGVVDEDGRLAVDFISSARQTVCVTDPSA